MTTQTGIQTGFGTVSRSKVRGFKGFVIGAVALAAAGTGIGIAITAGDARPTVVAPAVSDADVGRPAVAPESDRLERHPLSTQGSTRDIPEDELMYRPFGHPLVR
jgi:hypothetical protein